MIGDLCEVFKRKMSPLIDQNIIRNIISCLSRNNKCPELIMWAQQVI
jgi:hypothetical protein